MSAIKNENLPSKVQIGEEVRLEIGTAEPIKAWVKAIKFTDYSTVYDLAVQIGENEMTEMKDVEAAYVQAIVASVEHPARYYGRLALDSLNEGNAEAARKLLERCLA